jgi:acetyl esterase
VLITAEYDILHDEGVEYGQVLRAAGVQVEEVEGLGLYHGFATSTDLPSGARATAEVARKIVVLMGKGCTR